MLRRKSLQGGRNSTNGHLTTEIRKEYELEAAQVILDHRAVEVTRVYAERDMTKGLEVAICLIHRDHGSRRSRS